MEGWDELLQPGAPIKYQYKECLFNQAFNHKNQLMQHINRCSEACKYCCDPFSLPKSKISVRESFTFPLPKIRITT